MNGSKSTPLKSSKQIAYPLFLILLPILFSLIVFFGYYQAKQQYLASGIRNLQKQMNTITHLLEQYDGMVNEGLITRTEAQNIIKPMLSGPLLTNGKRDMSKTDMTLGLGDFLFVFDSKGNMIMHPELEGKNLLEQTNPEGRFVLKEIMAAPNNVLLYQWKNPSDTEQKPMITVNHYFAPWDWHIGLATYETNFYGWFESLKYLLISIVLGSYVITAILLTLARRKEKALRNSAMMSEHLSHTNESILMTLAVALEERDSYTSGHSQRVAYYMREIAKQMGYSTEMVETIHTGGLLHDIGKIGIEDSILLKQSRLTDREYDIIKTHPLRGEALLRRLYAISSKQDQAKIETILTITRSHHERFDGKGYPDNLRGEDIPLIARIAAVADSFDAMTSNRAYRMGMPFEVACNEITRHAGTQFCPIVVYTFFQCITEESFVHAHRLTRADELLIEQIEENEQPDGAALVTQM
ncbi:UNVERIFIED_CONTAM: HD-GYP domain-containing protein (c-di-GMP phosphodiesterase class II) [Brevibacillus sp. OAP136]